MLLKKTMFNVGFRKRSKFALIIYSYIYTSITTIHTTIKEVRKGTGTETKSQIQEVFRIYVDEAAGVFSY